MSLIEVPFSGQRLALDPGPWWLTSARVKTGQASSSGSGGGELASEQCCTSTRSTFLSPHVISEVGDDITIFVGD